MYHVKIRKNKFSQEFVREYVIMKRAFENQGEKGHYFSNGEKNMVRTVDTG